MNPKRGGLFWLIVVIAVLGGSLAMWIHFKAEEQDPRSKQYSKEQWLQMVRQARHQPSVRWAGIGCGRLRENGASISGCTLGFESSPAGVLEHQLDDLLKKDPMMFLPLFDSQHPQEILTGVYLYRRRYPGRDLKCTTEQKGQLEQAFRKLMDYRHDNRIRFAGIEYLGPRRLLTVEDVKKGLNDERLDVRFTTTQWIDCLYESKVSYSEGGKLLEGDPNRVRQLIEVKRKLGPILLDYVNDPHFYVRSSCARMFRDLFERPVQGKGNELVPGGPDKFDWMRESWQARDSKKAEWEKWWAEHGEEALQWAHPPQ